MHMHAVLHTNNNVTAFNCDIPWLKGVELSVPVIEESHDTRNVRFSGIDMHCRQLEQDISVTVDPV